MLSVFVDLILQACGKDDHLVEYIGTEHHNTLDKKTSSQRAIDDLGHKETMSLEEGIERTVDWQRSYYGIPR